MRHRQDPPRMTDLLPTVKKKKKKKKKIGNNFDPAIDPVWNRITGMIGEDAVAATRALLIGEDE